MNALELHGLEKHYPDFTLGPIDLELPGGTVCGLIGENGAGKSTTIKLILDMIDGDAGTVKLFGQEGITPLAKADIGVVLGGEGIPTCLTAPQVGKVMAGIYTNWDAAENSIQRRRDRRAKQTHEIFFCYLKFLAQRQGKAVLRPPAGVVVGKQVGGHHPQKNS